MFAAPSPRLNDDAARIDALKAEYIAQQRQKIIERKPDNTLIGIIAGVAVVVLLVVIVLAALYATNSQAAAEIVYCGDCTCKKNGATMTCSTCTLADYDPYTIPTRSSGYSLYNYTIDNVQGAFVVGETVNQTITPPSGCGGAAVTVSGTVRYFDSALRVLRVQLSDTYTGVSYKDYIDETSCDTLTVKTLMETLSQNNSFAQATLGSVVGATSKASAAVVGMPSFQTPSPVFAAGFWPDYSCSQYDEATIAVAVSGAGSYALLTCNDSSVQNRVTGYPLPNLPTVIRTTDADAQVVITYGVGSVLPASAFGTAATKTLTASAGEGSGLLLIAQQGLTWTVTVDWKITQSKGTVTKSFVFSNGADPGSAPGGATINTFTHYLGRYAALADMTVAKALDASSAFTLNASWTAANNYTIPTFSDSMNTLRSSSIPSTSYHAVRFIFPSLTEMGLQPV